MSVMVLGSKTQNKSAISADTEQVASKWKTYLNNQPNVFTGTLVIRFFDQDRLNNCTTKEI